MEITNIPRKAPGAMVLIWLPARLTLKTFAVKLREPLGIAVI